MKLFPHIEQGSREWRELRSQYFTASTLGDWLIEEPKLDLTVDQIKAELSANGIEFDKKSLRPALVELLPNEIYVANLAYTARRNDAWENAIETRLASISMDEEPEFDTWAMKRGRELEPMARAEYEIRRGLETVQVGFAAHESDDFGCSPDGLVPAIYHADVNPYLNGVELKCHVSRAHIGFLRRGGFREEHAMQAHASMAATGIREWHLFGFHPELPPLFEEFKWDATTDKVLAGLLRLSEDYWTAYAELKAMHQGASKAA